MKIAFRVDSSLQMGTGHVMRCLTLADALVLQGADCVFICREHQGNLIEHIRNKGYRVYPLPILPPSDTSSFPEPSLAHSRWLGATQLEDATACTAILAGLNLDWLIVDHYALDARWERVIKAHCRKLMVIDDLADRSHECNLLLDQTYSREHEDYLAWVPASCILLCGSQYALLRPEFAALRPYSLQRRAEPRLRHLLITMGGVDKDNVTSQVLEALHACSLPADCGITVIMGAAAAWVGEVEQLAQSMPWPTKVMIGVRNMAQLMADTDLAIGAAGATSWELCCLGVPSLLICTAANQRTVIAALASVRAVVELDRAALSQAGGTSFSAQYSELINNLEDYTAAAARISDGAGASRVCEQLVSLI